MSVSSPAATRSSPSSGPESARRSCPRARPRSAPIIARVQAGRLKGKDEIAFRLGKVLNRFKMEKHFISEIADDRLVVVRDEDSITAEAALDGIYVLRTTIGSDELDAAGVISAYKDLAGVERDFRSMKVIDVDLRPVHHRLEDRVRAHAFICMLSTYLTFHLRRSLAPLTFTDTEPPTRDDPVAPASASKAAKKKAAAKKNAEGQDVRGFRELLEHLGTLTRNRMRVASSPEIEFDLVATPTANSATCLRAPRRAGPKAPGVARTIWSAGVNSQVGGREHAFGKVSSA